MAEATKNSAAPKTANAPTNISSTREDQVKPDALKQAHDFELSSAPEDRYDLTYPGSVPPDVDPLAFEDSQTSANGADTPSATPIRDGGQPQSAVAPAATDDANPFSAEESAASAPTANSAPTSPAGGSSHASAESDLQPASLAVSETTGGEPISFASFSADEVPQTVVPTAFAEQTDTAVPAAFAEQADAPEQLQASGDDPAPEDSTPPPVPVNETPTALEAELSPIAENSDGHTIVGRLTTADPDSQDSHSYEIVGGHPLFEIDGDAITLKAGAQLDYETKDSYDLEIRSTDGAGNSIVKTVTVNVTDVNEAPDATAIGDQTASAGGAFSFDTSSHFSDVDHGDSLTYSIDGPEWLSIDAATGVVSGTPPAHLALQALTSGPDGGYELPSSGVVQLSTEMFSNWAGYGNSFGFYAADASGNPIGGAVVETNAHQEGQHATLIDLAAYPGATSLGFFIIPNGGNNNSALGDGQQVEFQLANGEWHAVADGHTLTGTGPGVYFSNPTLNSDGTDHLQDNNHSGNQNWEDLFGGGDNSFADVNAQISLSLVQAAPDAADVPVTITVTDSGGLSAQSSFNLNVEPSPVTIGDIENHTYDPTGSVVPAGPTDISLNNAGVAENSAAGTVVGHLSSVDANLSDSHSYEIVDGHPLFEISGDAIMLKAGAQLDYESQNGYDLEIRSTDGAGNSIVKTVTVSVTDVNEAPDATAISDQTASAGGAFSLDASSHFSDVDNGDSLTYSIDGPEWLSIDATTGVISGTPPAHIALQELTANANGGYEVPSSGVLQLNGQVLSTYAGYDNSVGYYLADASGTPIGGMIFEDNAKNLGESLSMIDLGEYPGAATLGFFIIPNGNQNAASVDGLKVDFQSTGGQWHASANGTQLNGSGTGVLFSDSSLNAKGFDYVVNNNHAGNLNWEDLVGGGDRDFEDVNAHVSLKIIQLVPDASGATVTVTATDSGGLTVQSSFDLTLEPADISSEQLGDYTVSGTNNSENVYGTESADRIAALGGNDIVYANGGNDFVWGDAGNDKVYGGDGDDTAWGGADADTLYGGTGNDTLGGDAGNDVVYGEDGNDTLYGGVGDDNLQGGNGNDTLSGEVGNDTLDGGSGDDSLTGGAGNDRLFGGEGRDTLDGGDGNDVVSAGNGNDFAHLGAGDDTFDTISGNRDDGDGADTVYGDAGNDTIWGGGSDDTLYGGDGNDYVNGELGNDTLYGDVGNDALHGDVGNDYLHGGAGTDQLYGGAGNDQLYGGAGNDTLFGGAGDDILFGTEGNDVMNGEDGSDLFTFSADGGIDVAHGGVGGTWVDTIQLTGAGGLGSPGALGTDWTIQLTNGHIVSQDEQGIALSDDAAGTITFDNHNQLTFTDMERIEC